RRTPSWSISNATSGRNTVAVYTRRQKSHEDEFATDRSATAAVQSSESLDLISHARQEPVREMREDLLRFLPFHEEINSGVMPISRIEKKKLVTLMPEKHEVVSVKPELRSRLLQEQLRILAKPHRSGEKKVTPDHEPPCGLAHSRHEFFVDGRQLQVKCVFDLRYFFRGASFDLAGTHEPGFAQPGNGIFNGLVH